MRPILPKSADIKSSTITTTTTNNNIQTKGRCREYHCSSCFMAITYYRDCKAHEQMCISRNAHLYICRFCLALIGDEQRLQRHIAQHHEDKQWMCLQCGGNRKVFSSPLYLYRHVNKWHGGHTLFHCAMCTKNGSAAKIFTNHDELKDHAVTAHELKATGVHSNSEVGSVADETEDLEMLEEIIEELVPLGDWEDDPQFAWPDGLCQQDCLDDFYEAPSNYVCPACGDGFTGSLTLLNHIAEAHKTRNPLDCIFCSKSHKTREAVRHHIQRQHSLVRPHICDICQRDFATTDHLQKHLRGVHQKGEQLICDKCGKSFSQRVHLKQHVETVHKTHTCILCDEQFHCIRDFKRHVTLVHPHRP